MPYTEEDLKAVVILPCLERLGFNRIDLSFEKSFSIKLGKKSYINRSSSYAHGRCDILCRKHGHNLFIVEAKKPGDDLTDADRDQGISYARLLDQIAPYVIVTNGEDARLFDSITKAEITQTALSNGVHKWENNAFIPSAQELLEIQYQALASFIALTPSNLILFCNMQIDSEMANLKGTFCDLNAKYIQETHVDRSELSESFTEFVRSEKSVFAIVGESGVGKSASICRLCTDWNNGDFLCLFINGTLLSESPLEVISSMLNLNFSETFNREKVLFRLNELLVHIDKSLLIFIDAIDEIARPEPPIVIHTLVKNCSPYSNVKICMTCKSPLWKEFLTYRGVNTSLVNSTFTPSRSFIGGSTSDSVLLGFQLPLFTDKELKNVLNNYQSCYNISGRFPSHLLADLRLGLIARLVCHINQDSPAIQSMYEAGIFKHWLNYVSAKAKLDSTETLISILVGIVELILEFESNSSYKESSVSIMDVRKHIGLAPTKSLPSYLFDYGILLSKRSDPSDSVQFTYTVLRDYIISNHYIPIVIARAGDLTSALSLLTCGFVGRSALHFLYMTSDQSNKDLIEQYMQSIAISYLHEYNSILDNDYAHCKNLFQPYTTGDIGLLIVRLGDSLSYSYGFFARDEGKPELAVETAHRSRDSHIAMLNYNVPTLSYTSNFLFSPMNIFIKSSIHDQLTNLIESGCLNDISSGILIKEKLICSYYIHHRNFGIPQFKTTTFFPRFENIFPIVLDDLSSKLKHHYASHYFCNKQLIKHIEDGRLSPDHTGSLVYNSTIFDSDEIEELAQRAILNGVDIPQLDISSPFRQINQSVNILLSAGVDMIEEPILPVPDLPNPGRTVYEPIPSLISELDIVNQHYSKKGLHKYINTLFILYDQAYFDLMSSCFPAHKHLFPFYNSFPHKFFVYIPTQLPLSQFTFAYSYCDSESGETEVEIRRNVEWFNDLSNLKEAFLQNSKEMNGLTLSGLLRLFCPRTSFSQSNLPAPLGSVDRNTDSIRTIWQWVYAKILKEYKDISI